MRNTNLNINGARRKISPPAAPTAFTSVFTVDTITGTLAWTDNSGGLAAYEVYSNTNGTGDELWDSKTSSGQIVTSGIYILYVETPAGKSVIRKFVIIR